MSTQLADEDRRAKIQRKRWPGAPYINYVDSKFHTRLLAMTRLGVLPIEIETGRWYGVPREERMCSFGCNKIGDTVHFLRECAHIGETRIESLNRFAPVNCAAVNPLTHWREIARRLERRWRERTRKLRCATDEPLNPADDHDDKHAAEINAVASQQILPNDIRFYYKEKQ